MKFDVVMSQFKLNILRLLLRKSYWKKRNTFERKEIPAALQTVSKNFNVGMHLDVYEWIWCKLGLMIDTIVVCILLLI